MNTPDPQKALETAKARKDTGDKAFQAGELQTALRSYHEALLHLKGLNSSTSEVISGGGTDAQKAPLSAEKIEINGVLEKVYSNMAACSIKQEKWNRAIDNADKAIALNENNHKAIFRKGKALGELGFFERSYKVLEDALKKNPADGPTIKAEIARFQAKEKVADKAAGEKFRGFLKK